MNIQIAYNNETGAENYKGGWGFACVVNETTLFDTGDNGSHLLHNLRQMKVDPAQFDAIVISHDHWDHNGGLPAVLDANTRADIYICSDFSEETIQTIEKTGRSPIQLTQPTEIAAGIFSTGTMRTHYKNNLLTEQALAVRSENGTSVITGCAHPGLLEILEHVRFHFKNDEFHAVLGGFHLYQSTAQVINIIADSLKKLKVRYAGPAHCSGALAEQIIGKAFGENTLKTETGTKLEI